MYRFKSKLNERCRKKTGVTTKNKENLNTLCKAKRQHFNNLIVSLKKMLRKTINPFFLDKVFKSITIMLTAVVNV